MIIKDLIEKNAKTPFHINLFHNSHTFAYNNDLYENYENKAIKDFGTYPVKWWNWEDEGNILEIWI